MHSRDFSDKINIAWGRGYCDRMPQLLVRSGTRVNVAKCVFTPTFLLSVPRCFDQGKVVEYQERLIHDFGAAAETAGRNFHCSFLK